jgi:NSS family neurotransmitter:Na+ symporter
MGHAFFTLSVGVGSIMVFGACMPKKSSIGGTIITVTLLGTAVALTAGLALFPIAFGNIVLGQVFGVLVAFICWLVGLGTVLSFNLLSEARFFVTDASGWHFFKWSAEGGRTFFESVDYLTSRIMLPLGGLLFAVFAGWVLGGDMFRAELALRHPLLFPVVYCLLRYVSPLGVLIVFVTELLK